MIITGTLPDSPARAAGLRAGDRITHVDGVVLDTDVSLVDVVSLITGEP